MEKIYLSNFAKNVKEHRIRLGLSQQDLAIEAKLALSTISKIERCEVVNIRLNTIVCIGEALGLEDPVELLY